MSNNYLSTDKQIAVTAALAEGSSIRSIERMTGIHRDTIMRFGVRIGQGCARLLDQRMRVDCNRIEITFGPVAICSRRVHERLHRRDPIGVCEASRLRGDLR